MSLLHEPAASTASVPALATFSGRRLPDPPVSEPKQPPRLTTPGRKRRVLVVSPQPFYEDRGTPIAVRQLVGALVELGCEVDLISYPIGTSPEIPGVRYLRCANPLRFTSVPVGFSFRKIILDAAIVWRLVRETGRTRYDAIHAIEEGAFPAALVARRMGIPLVYDMASSLPEQLSERRFFGLAPVQRLLRACERWLLRHADQVICSAGLAPLVRRIEPRVTLREWSFYAEPRAPLHEHERRVIREEMGVPDDRHAVLYTGNFASYQGVDLLLRAATKLCKRRPDIDFVLVGGQPGECREVRRGAIAAGLGDRIHVHPQRSRAHVSRMLQAADLVISPRCFGENLPLKIFDYLGAGRPIVATDIPTHRSILDESTAVLSTPTASGLADAVEGVLDDQARLATLASASAALADDRFGWQAFVAVVGGLYAEALGLGQARGEKRSEAIPLIPSATEPRVAASMLAS